MPLASTWRTVNADGDLAALDSLVQSHDSETVEVYAWSGHESYFPDDVARSGYHHLNWRLLIKSIARHIDFVELVFIDCEHIEWSWLHGPFFEGRVDTLRRVELQGLAGKTMVRCARLIYRTHATGSGVGPGFIASDLIPQD